MILNCGLHACPQNCHQLSDHSRMDCRAVVEHTCSRGHHLSTPCFQVDRFCRRCNAEDREKEAKRQRDLKLDMERERKKNEAEQEQRQRVLQQYQNDLAKLKSRGNSSVSNVNNDGSQPKEKASIMTAPNSTTITNAGRTPSGSSAFANSQQDDSSRTQNTEPSEARSEARDDWEYQKKFEGAQNDHIDELMEMIGLEKVKQKFLTIKAQVDTAVRQNVNLKDQRFGSVLTGNPGTGKPFQLPIPRTWSSEWSHACI